MANFKTGNARGAPEIRVMFAVVALAAIAVDSCSSRGSSRSAAGDSVGLDQLFLHDDDTWVQAASHSDIELASGGSMTSIPLFETTCAGMFSHSTIDFEAASRTFVVTRFSERYEITQTLVRQAGGRSNLAEELVDRAKSAIRSCDSSEDGGVTTADGSCRSMGSYPVCIARVDSLVSFVRLPGQFPVKDQKSLLDAMATRLENRTPDPKDRVLTPVGK